MITHGEQLRQDLIEHAFSNHFSVPVGDVDFPYIAFYDQEPVDYTVLPVLVVSIDDFTLYQNSIVAIREQGEETHFENVLYAQPPSFISFEISLDDDLQPYRELTYFGLFNRTKYDLEEINSGTLLFKGTVSNLGGNGDIKLSTTTIHEGDIVRLNSLTWTVFD